MSASVQETTLESTTSMVSVCTTGDLEPGWGEAAWVNGTQVAMYRTESDQFYATSHHCPGSGAKVMARGILGDKTIGGTRVPTIACPLHKEVYRLDTGACISAPSAALPIFAVHRLDDTLWMETGS